MIVVFDTNIWVSGLHFARQASVPTRALEKAVSEDTIATCTEMEDEVHRVLTAKFRCEPNRARDALAQSWPAPSESTSGNRQGLSRPEK